MYTGPKTDGAAVSAGTPGSAWTRGHIAALEIQTKQLYDLTRFQWGVPGARDVPTIDQAAVGLTIINPTPSSSVNDVHIFRFGRNSLLIDNHSALNKPGYFQVSDFFVGGSPRPIEVRGSRTNLLLRFGGIDLGVASELGINLVGDRAGAATVVASVKIEGDYDVPAATVSGASPVIFVASTRYLNQSLYLHDPMDSAPAFVYRDPLLRRTDVLQCLACTTLGQSLSLGLPDVGLGHPVPWWGGLTDSLSPDGARIVAQALRTPAIPLPRPQDVTNLERLCVAHDCDAALAHLSGKRYYLPAGVWRFSRPFTIPSTATLFGDGAAPGARGGTELEFVGTAIPGGAAVNFGGEGDMSAGRLFSLRVTTSVALANGFGIRARNATNGSTLQDIAVAGFPDGQVVVDGTPAKGPGPNFFRMSHFSVVGGRHPVMTMDGRENLLIEDGDIQLDTTSQEGLYLLGGEMQAAAHLVDSVRVRGNFDVPGYRVESNAANLFVSSSRVADPGVLNDAPGFLYSMTPSATVTPRPVMECLRCDASDARTAFAAPALGIAVRAPGPSAKFDYLNPRSPLSAIDAPWNTALPSVQGVPAIGETLMVSTGAWVPMPTAYSYQWLRCPIAKANYCVRIPGATRSVYEVTPADQGYALRATVSASNGPGVATGTSLSVAVKL